MFKRCALLTASSLLFISCGSTGTGFPSDVPINSPPVVARVDPSTGAAGDSLTIYGLGFSSVPAYNIVIIGGAAAAAEAYELVASPTAEEIEVLTASVPAGAQAGLDSLVVLVHESPSNSDIQFTVTP